MPAEEEFSRLTQQVVALTSPLAVLVGMMRAHRLLLPDDVEALLQTADALLPDRASTAAPELLATVRATLAKVMPRAPDA